MKWTTDQPKHWEYYWAKYKNEIDWLDATPEIVKVYFDGRIKVFRPGEPGTYGVNEFSEWSEDYIREPTDGPK